MTEDPDDTALTAREFTLAEAGLAEACGLPAADHGLLCCELGPGGAHVTLATSDVEYLQGLSGARAGAMAGLAFRPTSSRSAVQAGPTSGSPCPIRKSYGSSSLSRTWLEGAFPWGDLCRPQVRLMLFGQSAAGPREISSM